MLTTIPIDPRFLQHLIREAAEDLNRAKLRLEALRARMPQPEIQASDGAWRVPLSKDTKVKKNKI